MKPTLYIELDHGLGDNIICAGLLNYLAEHNEVYVSITGRQIKNRHTYNTFFANTKIIFVDERYSNVRIAEQDIVLKQNGREIRHVNKVADPKTVFTQLQSNTIRQRGAQLAYPLGFFIDRPISYKEKFKYCPLRKNSFNVLQIPAPKKPYIFMHEDEERGYLIDRKRIKSKLPIVKVKYDPNVSVLAYRELIENAAEIHCIDSSIFHLVNALLWPNKHISDVKGKTNGIPKLFYHWYARPYSPQFNMHPEWNKLK